MYRFKYHYYQMIFRTVWRSATLRHADNLLFLVIILLQNIIKGVYEMPMNKAYLKRTHNNATL